MARDPCQGIRSQGYATLGPQSLGETRALCPGSIKSTFHDVRPAVEGTVECIWAKGTGEEHKKPFEDAPSIQARNNLWSIGQSALLATWAPLRHRPKPLGPSPQRAVYLVLRLWTEAGGGRLAATIVTMCHPIRASSVAHRFRLPPPPLRFQRLPSNRLQVCKTIINVTWALISGPPHRCCISAPGLKRLHRRLHKPFNFYPAQ